MSKLLLHSKISQSAGSFWVPLRNTPINNNAIKTDQKIIYHDVKNAKPSRDYENVVWQVIDQQI